MIRWLTLVLVLVVVPLAPAKEGFRFPEGKHGKGELKYINGVPVLTVEGTPEEMGEAVGALALKPMKDIEALLKGFLKKTSLDVAWPIVVKSCEAMVKKMPPEHQREIEAMAKASGGNRELIVVANAIMDMVKLVGCSTIIVEPDRARDGKLLFGRNLDLPVIDGLAEFSLVTVYRPKGKHAFVMVGFPGVIAGASGMNDAGLCLAANEIYHAGDGSPRFDPAGKPMVSFMRRLMEEAGDVAGAEKIAREYSFTTMDSFTVCDPKKGVVLEVTPKSVGVRGADRGLCFCTNHFRCDGLATKSLCRRYAHLETTRQREKWALADVTKELDAVNQGPATMQSMVFEPASLTIHLSLGKAPTSALTPKKMEFADKLKR